MPCTWKMFSLFTGDIILSKINRSWTTCVLLNSSLICSLYAYIILHMLLYAANIYFWKHCRINYPFIFGFKQGTELSYQDVFLFSTGLAVLTLGTFLVHLHLKVDSVDSVYSKYTELVPLGLLIVWYEIISLAFACKNTHSLICFNFFVQVFLAIFFCPFNILYKSSRVFLIRCLFRCICAPLYKVFYRFKINNPKYIHVYPFYFFLSSSGITCWFFLGRSAH